MKFFLTNFFLIYLSFNCLSLGAQNDPDITRGKIADERRVLMEDLKQSKNEIILKTNEIVIKAEEITRLKANVNASKEKDIIIKNLQKRISKQNETIKRYQEDVSKYRDSLQKEYYVIDALEKQLQEEKLERDKDKEFQKTQNQRITQLENERTALKNTVAEYEKEREELIFFTSVIVQRINCISYDKKHIKFGFYVESRSGADKKEVDVMISVRRKYKLNSEGLYLKSCADSTFTKMKVVTNEETIVIFCSKEDIAKHSEYASSPSEYIIEIRIVFREQIIWIASYNVLDIKNCGSP